MYAIFDIQIFQQIQTICTSNVPNFLLNLRNSVHSTYPQNLKFLQIQTIRTSNVHNFLLNSRNSKNSNFLEILTIRTFNVQNFPLILCNFVHSTYSQNSNFLQIQTIRTSNVPISHRIYTILYIQCICKIQIFYKFRQSIHLMYTISS